MAAISFSMARNGGAEYTLAAGSQTVTEAANAPAAGDIEIRLADGVPWTKLELYQALETLWRFIDDVNETTSIPL